MVNVSLSYDYLVRILIPTCFKNDPVIRDTFPVVCLWCSFKSSTFGMDHTAAVSLSSQCSSTLVSYVDHLTSTYVTCITNAKDWKPEIKHHQASYRNVCSTLVEEHAMKVHVSMISKQLASQHTHLWIHGVIQKDRRQQQRCSWPSWNSQISSTAQAATKKR